MNTQVQQNPPVQRRGFLDWLSDRSPLWWFLVTTFLCYFIWHPFEMIPSLSSIILGDSVSLPIKALMSAVTLLALWLLVQGALAAMKVTGAIIIIILIALVMWVMVDFGLLDVLNPTLWQWVTQPIVGIIVAVGMYWARLRYGATGVRNTSDVDDE